jgi:CubicO group peptidase (beta-lactamase class C family)
VAGVTCYDTHFQQVASASAAGRYGAVIEIADAKGKLTRRYRTLFRVPDSLGPWHAASDDVARLPQLLATDPAALHSTPLDAAGNRDLSFLNQDDALANPDTAALAASLFDKQNATSPPDEPNDFRAQDRQWWVDLKRKLNHWDQQFPRPFVCPTTILGTPSPIVHADTPEKAGVNPAKVDQIDQICRRIVEETGEPVSICLVRHGVIFFHHAYGDLNARPFTVNDAGDIKSATKPLAGALMMEAIEQGLVKADEPIDKIFPSLRGIPVKRPMVISDLFDHLCGLIGDWGDQLPDTEEIIAGYYPAIDVGNFSYNEVGFALGGKVLEAASGESFPAFASHHLLVPLGMTHTRVTNAGGHNATTSLDFAKFGQLLLNGGTYANLRFFSQSTFNQMLPTTDPTSGAPRRGIGLMWMPWQKFGFAPGTFGHNAGNSSVLGIDPVHDLVVVIVSGGERKDFDGQAAPFYRAVIQAME